MSFREVFQYQILQISFLYVGVRKNIVSEVVILIINGDGFSAVVISAGCFEERWEDSCAARRFGDKLPRCPTRKHGVFTGTTGTSEDRTHASRAPRLPVIKVHSVDGGMEKGRERVEGTDRWREGCELELSTRLELFLLWIVDARENISFY